MQYSHLLKCGRWGAWRPPPRWCSLDNVLQLDVAWLSDAWKLLFSSVCQTLTALAYYVSIFWQHITHVYVIQHICDMRSVCVSVQCLFCVAGALRLHALCKTNDCMIRYSGGAPAHAVIFPHHFTVSFAYCHCKSLLQCVCLGPAGNCVGFYRFSYPTVLILHSL